MGYQKNQKILLPSQSFFLLERLVIIDEWFLIAIFGKKEMKNILIQPKSKKQFDLLTQLLKEMSVSFQIEKTQNKELDKLIDQTEKDINQSRTQKIKTATLWK